MDQRVGLLKKQLHAYKLLTEPNGVNKVLYGGGVGGGKSRLGVTWLLLDALANPGLRSAICRYELARIKETTLVTLQEVADLLKIDIRLNLQSHHIDLANGSRILMKELSNKPGKDPNFVGLGSLELGEAFIDEVTEISQRGVDILFSRIRKNMPSGEPKLLMTCNPEKGWVKEKFYDAWIEQREPGDQRFIQALPTDNHYLSKQYIKSLEKLNESDKQRLLFGNWEYADDQTQLFDSEYIKQLERESTKDTHYLTIDVATGVQQDRSVVLVWHGLTIIDYHASDDIDTANFVDVIKEYKQKYNVKSSNIIIDSDGIGTAVTDQLAKQHIKCRKFNANKKALRKENYKNLKSQCFFKMSERDVCCEIESVRQELKKELPIIRSERLQQGDGKLAVNSKDKQKRLLGRSPDFADAFMLRGFYEAIKK